MYIEVSKNIFQDGTTDQWFFRKAGYGPDGWMVGPEVDHESFMVTTRNKVG